MEILKEGNDTYVCISDDELKELKPGKPVVLFKEGYFFVTVSDDPKAFLDNIKNKGWKKPCHLSIVET